jgi:signal transduction histidine kinase
MAVHARDEEHFRILSELAPTSYTCVPLVSARGVLGVITFACAESGRRQTDRDLAFAQDLAGQASLAIENAFVYQRVNEANRLKDEFLATLSHELRTPLNAILGYAQLLNRGVMSGERHDHAMAILMRNAEALKQIIEDVLDVSRITSGKLRMKVQSVDLEEILQSAAATVQPAADAKGVSLQTTIGAGLLLVSGDPDRLQQVVWNLLSNAVKFTPRGGHVRLTLEQASDVTQIVVSDDGQGIDAAFLPHIFERFRQADGRFSRQHGGLGLGLSIVRELTELHGGTVTAASDGAGGGATFTVRLPRIAAPAVPLQPGDRPVARPVLPDRPGQRTV